MKPTVLLIAGFILLSSGNLFAQKSPVFSVNKEAIRGYDAVAYFTEGKAIKGLTEFSYQWQKTNWLFQNKTNLDSFAANPAKYAPQYGGYCAYGASENHKAPTSPEAFTIVGNKLYFNYSLKVKEMWSKEQLERIEKADSFWKTLRDAE
jgi:hypothetical protein